MADKWDDLADTLYKSQRFRAIVTDAEWAVLRNGDTAGMDTKALETLIGIEERYKDRYNIKPNYNSAEFGTNNKITHPKAVVGGLRTYNERYNEWVDRVEEKERAYTDLCGSIHRSDISGGYEFGTAEWKAWADLATPQEIHEMVVFDLGKIQFVNHFERLAPEDRRRAVDVIKADEEFDPYFEWIHNVRMDVKETREDQYYLNPVVNTEYAVLTLAESIILAGGGALMLVNPERWIKNVRYYGAYPGEIIPDAVDLGINLVGGMIMQFTIDPDLAVADLIVGYATVGSGKLGTTARGVTTGAKEAAIIQTASKTAKEMVNDVIKEEFKKWGGSPANRRQVIESVMKSQAVAEAKEAAAKYLAEETKRANAVGRTIEDIVGYEQAFTDWYNRNRNRGDLLDWDEYQNGLTSGKYVALEDVTIPERPGMLSLRGMKHQLDNLADWLNPEQITFQTDTAKQMARGEVPLSLRGLWKKENPKLSSFDAYLEARGSDVKRLYESEGTIGVLRQWNTWRKSWNTNEYTPAEMPTTWRERWLPDIESGRRPPWADWNFETASRWVEFQLYGKKRTFLREKGDNTKDLWVPRDLTLGGDAWYSTLKKLNPDADAYYRRIDDNTIELYYYNLEYGAKTKIKFRGSDAVTNANKWWADYTKKNKAGRFQNRYYAPGNDIPNWETFKHFRRVEVGKRKYVAATSRWTYRLGRRRGTHVAIDPRTGRTIEVIELTDVAPDAKGILFKHRPEIPALFPFNDDLWTLVSLDSLLRWRRALWYSSIGAHSYNEIYGEDDRIDLFGKPILDMERYSMFSVIYGEHAPYKDREGNPVNPLETEWGRWTPKGNIWSSEDFLYWIRKDEKYKDVDQDDLWSMKTGFDNGIIARVVRVIDGDTFDVRFSNGKVERIRMLGIDTPETHDPANRSGRAGKFSRTGSMQDGEYLYYWGKEAAMTSATLIEGKDVLVVFDSNTGVHGGFGRLLAHIYYMDGDGEWQNLTEYLLKRGLGRVYPQGENEGQEYYLELMQEAAAEGKGVWLMADTNTDAWARFIESISLDISEGVADGQLKSTEDAIMGARSVR